MASVTGYTAARMQEIEDQAIVTGAVVGDNLVLTRYDGGTINAGNVRGPIGNTGPAATIPSVARVRAVFALDVFQSVSNGTVTVVAFANEEYDTNGFHSTTTNTGRLTVPVGYAGVYIVTYSLYFATTASGICSGWVTKNAVSTRYASSQQKNDSTNGAIITSSEIMPLAEGDYVQLQVFQNSGGALNCGQNISGFGMARLGPL